MDIMELGAIGEFVSALAVIGSLVFVGLQIRHSNRLAQGAADLEIGRMKMGYLRLGAEADMASVLEKAFFEADSLTDGEKLRFIWSQGMWLHMVQSMYKQYRRGLLAEDSWKVLITTLVTGL